MVKRPSAEELGALDQRVQSIARKFGITSGEHVGVYATGLVYPDYGTVSDEVQIRFADHRDWSVTVDRFQGVVAEAYTGTGNSFLFRGRSTLEEADGPVSRMRYERFRGNLLRVVDLGTVGSERRPRRPRRADIRDTMIIKRELVGFRPKIPKTS